MPTMGMMGATSNPVPGTGTDHKMFFHAGVEAQVTLGPLSRPLAISALWMYGQEDQALVANGTRDARFHGGFVEIDYTPLLAVTAFFRYDGVYNLQQADLAQPANSNQQEALTFGGRYALFLSAWGSVVLHLEASTIRTENAAMTAGNPVRTTVLFAGLDFAI